VLQLFGQMLQVLVAVTYRPNSHSWQMVEELHEIQPVILNEHNLQVLGEAETSK
jgi:hypothetical protein